MRKRRGNATRAHLRVQVRDDVEELRGDLARLRLEVLRGGACELAGEAVSQSLTSVMHH